MMDERLKEVADYYKLYGQLIKTVEELGELSTECAKALGGKLNDNMYSEIADVSIMLEQIIYLLGCEKKVEEQIEYKIRRQVGRMNIAKKGVNKNEQTGR